MGDNHKMNPEVDYRPIPGFYGYFAGSDGSIWSRRIQGNPIPRRLSQNARRLSIYRRPYGACYCVVCFRSQPNGRVSCHYVHRLVLETFIGACPDGFVCCHKDGDTTNNQISNLRWDTIKSNIADKWDHGTAEFGEDHHSAHLTNQSVRTIRHLVQMGVPPGLIEAMYGLASGGARNIFRGDSWSRVPSPLLPKEVSHY